MDQAYFDLFLNNEETEFFEDIEDVGYIPESSRLNSRKWQNNWVRNHQYVTGEHNRSVGYYAQHGKRHQRCGGFAGCGYCEGNFTKHSTYNMTNSNSQLRELGYNQFPKKKEHMTGQASTANEQTTKYNVSNFNHENGLEPCHCRECGAKPIILLSEPAWYRPIWGYRTTYASSSLNIYSFICHCETNKVAGETMANAISKWNKEQEN